MVLHSHALSTLIPRFWNSLNFKVTLSAKSSLILGENKAAFRRECHFYFIFNDNNGHYLNEVPY